MSKKGKKLRRVSISISESTLDFIDTEIEKGTYYNRSHALQKLVADEKERRQK